MWTNLVMLIERNNFVTTQMETLVPAAIKKGESLADVKKRAKVDSDAPGSCLIVNTDTF